MQLAKCRCGLSVGGTFPLFETRCHAAKRPVLECIDGDCVAQIVLYSPSSLPMIFTTPEKKGSKKMKEEKSKPILCCSYVHRSMTKFLVSSSLQKRHLS